MRALRPTRGADFTPVDLQRAVEAKGDRAPNRVLGTSIPPLPRPPSERASHSQNHGGSISACWSRLTELQYSSAALVAAELIPSLWWMMQGGPRQGRDQPRRRGSLHAVAALFTGGPCSVGGGAVRRVRRTTDGLLGLVGSVSQPRWQGSPPAPPPPPPPCGVPEGTGSV